MLGGRLLRRIDALRPTCRAGMKCLVRLFRLFTVVHMHIPMLLVSLCGRVNPSPTYHSEAQAVILPQTLVPKERPAVPSSEHA